MVCIAECAPKRSTLVKLKDALRSLKQRRSLLFRLYARWDRRHTANGDHPLRQTDCGTYLNDAEWMDVTPLARGAVHSFPSDAIEHIRARKLDVLIRFGFNILRGEILQAARYGVWSYHHGDNEFYRGGPPCFWEMVEGNPVTGAMLQVLTEELDAGKVLYKGMFATQGGGSWSRNRLQPCWGASTFVIQKLQQLYEQGWERVESEALAQVPYQGKREIYSAPTNAQLLRWLVPTMAGCALLAVTA